MTAPAPVPLGAPPAFDVRGALPTGTTVLEASAGTGKTFTIAALATRYLAEGFAQLDELMLVTFSRAATRELRERVRSRLLSAEAGLADPHVARESEDTVVRHLGQAGDEEVAVRRHRLRTALSRFDAATIATTHEFCHQMLVGLGVAGDVERGEVFVESLEDLVEEVTDDLYLRKFAAPDASAPPPLKRGLALRVAGVAVNDRHAVLAPVGAPEGSEADVRVRLAAAVRLEVERRKRLRRLVSYDDQLTRLAASLADPVSGTAACERLRSRFRVALVDEFQDTDPVQWEILSSAFHGHRTLVLIGDPKQAIYAFRGADVVTYLQAAAAADTTATLSTNWRSDQSLIDALDVVFAGAALGDSRIVYRQVCAAHQGGRLLDAPAGAPLRLRVVTRGQVRCGTAGLPLAPPARAFVAEDAASDIARLLSARPRLDDDGGERPLRPGDVAVLTRTNVQADLVREALREVGVPAVITGTSSVFGTAVAWEWQVLLEAIEQPQRTGRVRAAALTSFLGWTAQRLAEAGDDAVDALRVLLRRWADVLAGQGVAALLESMSAMENLPARVLAGTDGERRMTDLRHVGQALHGAAVEGGLGISALVSWLRRRRDEAGEDATEERSRRLESDAEAVQVVTVHRAKGLEFPVVYVPFGWDAYRDSKPNTVQFHSDDGTRILDVGGASGPDWAHHRDRYYHEDGGEALRLLYVALTRARHRAVVWWVPATTTQYSPLNRLLFGRGAPGTEPAEGPVLRPDADARAILDGLSQQANGLLCIEDALPDGTAHWEPSRPESGGLDAARFNRRLDQWWRRTSYTALTSDAHAPTSGSPGSSGGGPVVGSEPEAEERADEPTAAGSAAARAGGSAAAPAGGSAAGSAGAPAGSPADAALLRGITSPMADLPAGTAFGTLVHAVLERVDFAAPDLAAELADRVGEQLRRRPDPRVDAAQLASALFAVLETPLGGTAGKLRLRDVTAADRLAELTFELPLAGGDEAGRGASDRTASDRVGDPSLARIAAAMRRHLGRDDPLAGYPGRLEALAATGQGMRGYLTGSLDAVLRLRGDDGQARFVVVDYKTNWLGAWGLDGAAEPDAPDAPAGADGLTAWHYRPEALVPAMVSAQYPLQALLYLVALHRFLRWRQPGYMPERHLGGALYLFLRGMCGPDTPSVNGARCGVFAWQPPPGLVVDVSDLFDRGGL